MDWLSFFGSILGGLIGGVFTFLGVRITIKHQDTIKKQEGQKEAIDKKPRLEIIEVSEYELDVEKVPEVRADVNALVLKIKSFKEENGHSMFEYDYFSEEKQFYCFEFNMKNTGFTEIEDVCLTTNLPKETSIFDYYSREMYLYHKLLNYDVWSNKRYIKQGNNLKMLFMFPKGKVISSNLGSAIISIWLKDVNGRLWHQPLFVRMKETEISRLANYNEFKNAINVSDAIECFKKPYMW